MDSFYQELLKKQKELKTTLSAVEELLKVYTPVNEQVEKSQLKPDVPIDIFPVDYDKRMSIKKKVHYVLGLIGNGTASEVSNKLIEIDDEFDLKRASRSATHYLSDLYRNGEIGAAKLGNKYNYFIKK